MKSPDSSGRDLEVRDTSDSAEPSVAEMISEFRDSVQRETILDTTRIVGHDTLHLTVHQKRVENSSFLLPRRYLEEVQLDSFRAWNMVSVVQLRVNGQLTLNMDVGKKDFSPLMDETLQHFGVLMFPEVIKLEKYTIEVGYSITIPFTDVGIGVLAKNVNGKVSFGRVAEQ